MNISLEPTTIFNHEIYRDSGFYMKGSFRLSDYRCLEVGMDRDPCPKKAIQLYQELQLRPLLLCFQ